MSGVSCLVTVFSQQIFLQASATNFIVFHERGAPQSIVNYGIKYSLGYEGRYVASPAYFATTYTKLEKAKLEIQQFFVASAFGYDHASLHEGVSVL